ncbi:hypothetical protein PaeBR_15925 [Paenibacillus sp. BR2-3]|uniref:hypothetical protein n=1 Tax=Paenibacillus sp. BR2-3 TaxID=3048494 RepID=UPI00397797B8
MDAPRTDRCSNRCALQILFIFLNGKNPESKATAAAFPQSFRPLRCFQLGTIPIISLKTAKRNLEVGWLSLAHNLLKRAATDQ